ncbi:periplasmic heavy metal sensor [bacterium]|nr:periplasmic heavy metal sensor [bacterium]
MRRKTLLITLAVISLISLTSFIVWSQPCMKGDMEHGGGRLMKMLDGGMLDEYADEIQLTEQQLTQIQDLRYQVEKSMIDLRADMEKKSLELRKLLDEDSPDRNKAHQYIENISGIQAEMKILGTDLILDIKDMLSDEQLDRIKNIRKENREGKMDMNMKKDMQHGDCQHNKD